jgi:hypothetical protein
LVVGDIALVVGGPISSRVATVASSAPIRR